MRSGDKLASAGDDPDALVAEIDAARDGLRDSARRTLGIVGEEEIPSLRSLRRDGRLPVYPLVALGLLSAADMFQSYALTVLTPEISRTLGVSIGAIALGRSLQFLAMALAPLPVAALTQHRSRRALLCIVTGVAWSVTTLCTGFIISLFGLLVILALNGLASGSVSALHAPLVMDSYHPSARVRAMSVYTAFGSLGNVVSPLLVALLAGALGFTWRGVFLALGLTSLTMALIATGLRDPGFGKWDTDRLRSAVRAREGVTERLDRAEVQLGFWEICRRMLTVPTNRRLYGGFVVLGIVTIPFWTYLSVFLELRWNLGPGERGLFLALFFGAGVVGLLTYGRRGERQFREDPSKLLHTVGVLLAGAVSLVAVGALMPVFGVVLVCFGLAGALLAILQPGLAIGMLSIVPSQMRPHAQALAGIFTAVGGFCGVVFMSGIDESYGVSGALVAIMVPGVAGGLILASAAKFVDADLDRMIDEVLEDEEIRVIRDSGGHLPMLACRGIDFSYGQLQVLFDVDFTVDDGEMVALLGVNGAGKSTLLRVVSGIGLPDRGTVRFQGHDITYLDAERRLRIGITQIPGGNAVFGRMTVLENLRSFGYTIGADRRALTRAIDTSFEAFPRLHERQSSPAGALSGGEQQMLALSKALMLRPRLLLIDELSLGLAPVVVGQLLEMVRRINAEGTAVVLVEQSVNIALNLVEHAYFMEKGEMRFDGRSSDLLARDDLLRAVFLQGTAAGVAL